MMYPYNAIVKRDSYETLVENASRKYLRRVARKKYTVEYRVEKTVVIISGEDKKDAISLYKSILQKSIDKATNPIPTKKTITSSTMNHKKKTTEKIVAVEKLSDRIKKHQSDKSIVLSTMLNETIAEEEKRNAKINAKNIK